MRRLGMVGAILLGAAAAGLLPALPAGAHDVSIGISIGLPLPPPPPVVVAAPPALVVVPGTPVYYAPALSYNYFFYAGHYYTFHDGAWFYAHAYNGPWGFVAAHRVPQPLLAVPVAYYRVPPGHLRHPHGGPPGHGKWNGRR